MAWTTFNDMHSGGGRKLSHEFIIIEDTEEMAIKIFQERFDRHPLNVSCECCGEDYSIREYPTLEAATAYKRGCDYSKEEWCGESYRPYITLADYLASDKVLVIRTSIDGEVIKDLPTLGCKKV